MHADALLPARRLDRDIYPGKDDVVSVPDHTSVGERLLETVVTASHTAAPDEIAGLIAEAATMIGVTETVLYLSDIEQLHLVPLPGPGVPPREPLEIDNSIAGRAYRTISVLETQPDGRRRMWVPLLDGTSRIGILELTLPDLDDLTRSRAVALAGVVAELVVSKDLYSDVFKRARRQRHMSLAAEMQSELLPPLTFSTATLVIAGVLEPSYEIAGDTFDYALNGDTLHILIIDAMGHGFEATLMSSVAVGAYRHARRRGDDLLATYGAMDSIIEEQFGLDRFVTAQIAELNTGSGRLRWLNAGHHPPMLVRRNRMVGALESEPALPLGLGQGPTSVAEVDLEPGDQLLFYTDGVVESRDANGEFFGHERLADLLVRALTAELPAAETVRRLAHGILAHQHDYLQDDATVLLLQWLERSQGG